MIINLGPVHPYVAGCKTARQHSSPINLGMADDAPRTLVCLIAGESSLFKVRPTGDMDIIELKDLIKEKGINATEHARAVLAKDLTLWKVRMTMACDSDSTTNSPAA